jgi:hypothetical protein
MRPAHPDNGIPVARRVRKTRGLTETAQFPKEKAMLTLYSTRWARKWLALLLATGGMLSVSAIGGTSAYGGPSHARAAKAARARHACRSRRHAPCPTARSRGSAAGKAANTADARRSEWWTTHRRAPQLTVSAGALHWTQVAQVNRYRLNARVAGHGVGTWLVTGTSATPPTVPGKTVSYRVRTAVYESSWSDEQAIAYPSGGDETGTPPEEEAHRVPAPVLSVHGDTVSWSPIPGTTSYTLATIEDPASTRTTTYTTVTGTSVTPPAVPGQTVNYGLAVHTPTGGPWAKEVTIAYAPATSGEGEEGATSEEGGTPEEGPTFAHKIIGTNDAAGWGPAAAATIRAGHITWNRVEIGSQDNPIAASEQEGFHSLAVVGNVEDSTPLGRVNPASWASTVVGQLQANPNVAIAEAGNEMFLKGGVANPVQYGRMYLAAVEAMQAAGIHKPLLFNMFGDYVRSNETWSNDNEGGGWLRDAVNGVPGLAGAILANGLSTHPYGALNENSADDYGVLAVAAEERVAQAVLGAVPPVYITEFGFDLGRCGEVDGACSQAEQASKLKAAYEVFLADPHVAGIWVYQSHDDGTGQWGYMNNDNSARPAFEVLSAFAVEQGQ